VTTENRDVPTFRPPWAAFWVALLLRIGYMTIAHTWRFGAYEDHFQFGHEMGRIGRALATGYGYADPFRGHTGPTAWLPPVYPLIIASAFKLFGVYSGLSAWFILAFNSVLSAAMTCTVWEIAARCFRRSVADWSAWVWALYPAAMQYAVKWVWETTLTAFLFTCVLVLALRMRNIGGPPENAATPRRWLLFGLLWGLIALTNPSLLLFLPACGLWILAGTPRSAPAQWRRQLFAALLAACIFVLCLAPWTYRNWRAFHTFVPIRANFGVELYLGNGSGAHGLLMGFDHPFMSPIQLQQYRQLGEIAYATKRGDMAKQIIREDPARFLRLCLIRAYYFWAGVPRTSAPGIMKEYGPDLNYDFVSIVGVLGLALALKRRVPAAWLFFWAFALLPLTYYMVTIAARFRHPLEPLIAILGVYLFQSAEKSWKVRWFTRRPSPATA
jgi:4-amino-4-deoxy-L-arabinose transferase-like glycosyltransferase